MLVTGGLLFSIQYSVLGSRLSGLGLRLQLWEGFGFAVRSASPSGDECVHPYVVVIRHTSDWLLVPSFRDDAKVFR